ncbi:MAG: hypothetical protein IT434_13095 [Phycisphaerales bacterium]|nr:hypothetical protein [Phycisphaerales bacterium]
MLRVLQIGLGPLGRMIVEHLHATGIGSVIDAVDQDPAIRGKHLGAIVANAGPTPPRVMGSLGEISPGNADIAIVTTSSALDACAPTFKELLTRGLPIVSTCEELLFPWLRHRELATELDAMARRTGGRLLGTGVNPGFLMDTLPLVATAVCRDVRGLLIERIQDASSRRIPFQRKIGVGLTPDQFASKVGEGTLRHVGLGESLHFVSHYLGLRLDAWSEAIEPIITGIPLISGLGPVAPGQAAGVRQIATGSRQGREVIRMEFAAAIGQPNPHDRVRIDADPPVDLILRGGVHGDKATTHITVNAIPSLIDASAGLHTMATIRPVHAVATAPVPVPTRVSHTVAQGVARP